MLVITKDHRITKKKKSDRLLDDRSHRIERDAAAAAPLDLRMKRNLQPLKTY